LTKEEHDARKMAYLDKIAEKNRKQRYDDMTRKYTIIAKTDPGLSNHHKLAEGHVSNNAETPEERRRRLANNHQQAGPSTPRPTQVHDPNKWRYDILERGGINRPSNEQPLVPVEERISIPQSDPKNETREERRAKMLAGRNM
jgi:hypothetical protein